jgi:hypothetical protein
MAPRPSCFSMRWQNTATRCIVAFSFDLCHRPVVQVLQMLQAHPEQCDSIVLHLLLCRHRSCYVNAACHPILGFLKESAGLG